MKYTKRSYRLGVSGQHQITEEVVEETTPLTAAVEAIAAAFPGQVIVGMSVNDEVVHVAPLDPQPEPPATEGR